MTEQRATQYTSEWTEGVCGDGAAILRDGVMVPIEEVIETLNRYEEVLSVITRRERREEYRYKAYDEPLPPGVYQGSEITYPQVRNALARACAAAVEVGDMERAKRFADAYQSVSELYSEMVV